jgi:hypothetical protein
VISAFVLVGVILLGGLVLTGGQVGALTAAERTYLLCAPLPVLLTFVVPAAFSLLLHDPAGTRPWSDRVSAAGVWLSGGMLLVGLVLLGLRRSRKNPPDRRLLVALLIATIPALLFGVLIFLYLPWS